VDTRVISNVYEEFDKMVQENNEKEESESPKLDYRDIKRISLFYPIYRKMTDRFLNNRREHRWKFEICLN
jgi:hypothetical protein